MMTAHILIAASVFVVTILLLAAAASFYAVRSKRRGIVDKIRGCEQRLVLERSPDIMHSGQKGVKGAFLNIMGTLGRKVGPEAEGNISDIRRRLLQAGYRRQNGPIVFFGFRIFFAALLSGLAVIGRIFVVQAVPSAQFMTMAALLGLIGYLLPGLWLSMRTASRKEKMLEGFPDALDLMVVCVEAGMGLDGAINRVGEEMKLRNEVLSEEFRLLGLELRAGKPRREALRNLAVRTGLEDVNSLMTLLIQTDKFGTSVAQALRVHSDSMRVKRYQRAEELAAKLPVKLLFPLILFILPSLFVAVVGPAIINIYRVLLPIIRSQ